MEMEATVTDGRDPGEGDPFPWPPGAGASTVDALGRTWSWSMFRPATFFRALSPSAPLSGAVSFHVLCTLAGAGAELFWRMTLPGSAGPGGGTPSDPLLEFVLAVPLGLLALAVFALLLHAAMFTLGAARHGVGATLRTLLYTAGPSLFLVVPWVGLPVAVAWGLALTVIGLREMHSATTGRAVAAVVLVVFGFLVAISLVILAGVLLGLLATEPAGWI